MSKENSAGLGVNNRYGTLQTPDGVAGVYNTRGTIQEMVLEISGKNINDGVILGTLPAGAKPIRAIVEIEEAFVMTGTDPVLEVGTSGSEATNGFTIEDADAEVAGTYVITTFAGTWAVELTAVTEVSVIVDASANPVVTDAGNARIVLEYALN